MELAGLDLEFIQPAGRERRGEAVDGLQNDLAQVL